MSLIFKKTLISAILVFLSAGLLAAYDFGLVIGESPEYSADGFANTISVGPWFAAPVGENTGFYASGSFDLNYDKDNNWEPIPQLNRTVFLFYPATGLSLELGRVTFSDPLGIIASGLFDGLKGSLAVKETRLSLGLFYTGLLYKKAAEIKLTGDDYLNYIDSDVYFASRRFLGGLNWEIPVLFGSSLSASLTGLVQFDLNGKDDYLHSQYLGAKFMIPLITGLDLNLAAALDLAERESGDPGIGLAGSAGVNWLVPSKLQDLLSFTILWSSGAKENAFVPVTAIPQGRVFDPILSGLMTIKTNYTLSLNPSISVSADLGYFLRTDLGASFSDSYYTRYVKADSYALGTELYGSVIWAPVSDLQAVLGAGVFLPGLGDALDSDAPIRGKISLGLAFSL
ncbi:hypothetical protein [Treponema primitia]|uniref:hypothetical protein n=1 Tax=Treponema primitia TaxID=88058 RepID=UPI0002555694|nr:hypothetical protein [Treponema primitia]